HCFTCSFPKAHRLPTIGSRHAVMRPMQTIDSPTTTPSNTLYAKLEDRTARIGVIGLGYVGLPLALLLSEQKFRVTGFDIDAQKIHVLSQGGSYIVRITEAEIQAAKGSGFAATADYAQISQMDA